MRKWISKGRQMWKRYLPHVRDRSKVLRVRHINLFFAMTFSLAGAVVIAIVAAWVLAPLLNVGTQTTPPADLTRLALTIAAGVGGVVALVVAYRRQRDLEQGRFVEHFGAAAAQLGNADVAVRMAGVYAMAGVANQTSKLQRQQCIDVLCGYLRLPYSPEIGNNHQSGRTLKMPVLREGGLEEELRFQYRQNDKEVRQTIVRVITAHLQEKATTSWSSNDFDFTGAHLEAPNFDGAFFSGEYTSFYGATFSGQNTAFDGASFSGENTWFDGASFSGEYTSFDGASFSGEYTSFAGATFSGENTWFDGASFSGEYTFFAGVTFSGENTSFAGATFSGENTSFDQASFSGENTFFAGVTFSGENTIFAGATFSGGYSYFAGASFSGEFTSFYGATFSGEYTLFAEVTFNGGRASFIETIFSGEYIWFDGTSFSGDTSFDGASFSGKNTSFKKVDFGDSMVTFDNPKVWSPAPTFDWDRDLTLKPANVRPKDWPPVEQVSV
jgi:uncharacterized protein YjbI with pentapeptide repeats